MAMATIIEGNKMDIFTMFQKIISIINKGTLEGLMVVGDNR